MGPNGQPILIPNNQIDPKFIQQIQQDQVETNNNKTHNNMQDQFRIQKENELEELYRKFNLEKKEQYDKFDKIGNELRQTSTELEKKRQGLLMHEEKINNKNKILLQQLEDLRKMNSDLKSKLNFNQNNNSRMNSQMNNRMNSQMNANSYQKKNLNNMNLNNFQNKPTLEKNYNQNINFQNNDKELQMKLNKLRELQKLKQQISNQSL